MSKTQDYDTILSHRGYSISKKNVSAAVLAQYRSDLTVMPFVERQEFAYNIKPIQLYVDTPKRFYMPRHYGTQKLGPPKVDKISDTNPTKINVPIVIEPRAAQKPIIEKAMHGLNTIGGGVISAYCGMGKTFMALYIASKMGVKAMIVCHTTSLMQQWVERIQDFIPSARVGIIQQDLAEIDDKDLIIASLKTLAIKDFPKDSFDSIGLVIWDEIHLMCTNTFSNAFPKCAVKYSLGLSATPYRKDKCDVIFQYYIGPVLYLLKRPKDDVITAQCITFTIPPEEIKVRYDRRGKVLYVPALQSALFHPKRMKRIVEIIVEHARNGRKILVLGEYVQHLKDIMVMIIKRETEIHEELLNERMRLVNETLQKIKPTFCVDVINTIVHYLRESYGDSLFTYGLYIGEMDALERKESETKDVILGTYKLASVGMDIPHLNTLLMASPRKEIEQSVGRILRKKTGAKEHKPLIIDIIDNHGLFSSQARARKNFYKEYGYVIEHIRMNPATGDIERKRVIDTGAKLKETVADSVVCAPSKISKLDLSEPIEGMLQTTITSFKPVPRVTLTSSSDSKVDEDVCLLDSSDE